MCHSQPLMAIKFGIASNLQRLWPSHGLFLLIAELHLQILVRALTGAWMKSWRRCSMTPSMWMIGVSTGTCRQRTSQSLPVFLFPTANQCPHCYGRAQKCAHMWAAQGMRIPMQTDASCCGRPSQIRAAISRCSIRCLRIARAHCLGEHETDCHVA